MQTGDIIIVSFPFTDLINFKARPAVVVTQTKDNFSDIIVCLITSKIDSHQSKFHIILQPSSTNNLKAPSILKVERIATIEENKIIAVIGKLNPNQLKEFKAIFKSLVD